MARSSSCTSTPDPHHPRRFASHLASVHALQHLVINTEWDQLLTQINANGIETTLFWGTNDATGDPTYVQEMTEGHPKTKVAFIAEANHHLPMTHPNLCLRHLTANPAVWL